MKTFKTYKAFMEGKNSDEKGDGEEYKKFFQAALKKFGVTDQSELKGDDKKKFYDYVDANWEGDDEKEEEMSMYQKYGKGKKKKEEEMSMYQKYGKGKKK